MTYKIGNLCQSNESCQSGFCDQGKCSMPSFGNECNPNQNMCLYPFVCDFISKRCTADNISMQGEKIASNYGLSEMDCWSTEFCEYGTCKIRRSEGDFCGFDHDCKDGLKCLLRTNKCVKKCFESTDCKYNYVCDKSESRWSSDPRIGYCVPKTQSVKKYISTRKTSNNKKNLKFCTVNKDCWDTEFCQYGICQTRRALDNFCQFDYECKDGLKCSLEIKKCVKICYDSTDCEPNYIRDKSGYQRNGSRKTGHKVPYKPPQPMNNHTGKSKNSFNVISISMIVILSTVAIVVVFASYFMLRKKIKTNTTDDDVRIVRYDNHENAQTTVSYNYWTGSQSPTQNYMSPPDTPYTPVQLVEVSSDSISPPSYESVFSSSE